MARPTELIEIDGEIEHLRRRINDLTQSLAVTDATADLARKELARLNAYIGGVHGEHGRGIGALQQTCADLIKSLDAVATETQKRLDEIRANLDELDDIVESHLKVTQRLDARQNQAHDWLTALEARIAQLEADDNP